MELEKSRNHQFVNLFLSLSLIVGLIATVDGISQARDIQSNAAKPSSTTAPAIHKLSCSTCTLSVTPNPAPASSTFHASGCGYTPGVAVQMTLWSPQAIASTVAGVDSTGCMNLDWSTNQSKGTYTLTASVCDSRSHCTYAAVTTILVY